LYKKYLKRFFDIVFSLLALPFFLLFLFLLGPIIYFSDRGSIFYNAPRLGKNGRVFKMYKFRSMKMNVPDIRNKDGSTFNSEDDKRITRIGKFLRKTSIDELPQIINVMKGDMSLIGPRPVMSNFNDFFKDDNVSQRFEVKPGITGYSQAYFRNSVSQLEKMKHDVFYVKNISFILDLKILARTLIIVIKKKNVYRNR
jgi:lipopolysaccharide/colanic/teichoic acid biosynthesis glycosyltransferase